MYSLGSVALLGSLPLEERGKDTVIVTPGFFCTQRKSLVLSSMKMDTFVEHLSSGCCKDKLEGDMGPLCRMRLLFCLGADRAGTDSHRYFGVSDLFQALCVYSTELNLTGPHLSVELFCLVLQVSGRRHYLRCCDKG